MSSINGSKVGIDASIEHVHNQVIASLLLADQHVDIRRTGYFNHTYAPDLVLKWGSSKEERHLFVRTSDSPTYLAEDILLARDSDPIFVPISGVKAEIEDQIDTSQKLVDQSKRGRALIADVESFVALTGASEESRPINALVGRAVLQGGSGLLGQGAAREFGTVIENGFTGALSGEAGVTQSAIRESLELLDGRRSAQFAELLQAAWVGGGQPASTFPGVGTASVSLDPEALRLLLDTIAIDEEEFWDRLARNLNLSNFAGLTIAQTHPGFQMLMNAAAPRLKAKAARVYGFEEEASERARWALANGKLLLALGRSRLEFAVKSIEDFESDGEEAASSVESFVHRAKAADLTIQRVVLSSDDRKLEFTSADGTSVAADDRLLALEEEVGVGTVVSKAFVFVEGRELGINLDSSTASGNTRSQFYVSSLSQTMLPLTMDLTSTEQIELARVFEAPEALATNAEPLEDQDSSAED